MFFVSSFVWIVTYTFRYYGGNGYIYDGVPTLAIGLRDGRVQVSAGVEDDAPLYVRTGLCLEHVKWNFDGSMLALGGGQVRPSREIQMPMALYVKRGEWLSIKIWELTGTLEFRLLCWQLLCWFDFNIAFLTVE